MTVGPEEQVVLVSSAEFVLKTSHVRRTLEQRLIDDIRFTLRKSNIHNFTIGKAASRIVVSGVTDSRSAAKAIARIFGVAYAIPAIRVDGSIESVLKAVLQKAAESLTFGQSFAIRCHRSAMVPISTRDVERRGGSQILEALADRNIRVNLDEPDVLISVDLLAKEAHLYTTRVPGPGGLPLSSQWKMLAPLDSPLSLVAAYVMMRRGCLTQLLIPCSAFDARFPAEGQIAMARRLREFVTRENYPGYILNLDAVPRAANIIRHTGLEFASKRRFRGIVFADVGGSIALDSSINKRSRELGLPIFQPLIGCNEAELSNLGEALGVEWRDLNDNHVQANSTESLSLLALPISEVSL